MSWVDETLISAISHPSRQQFFFRCSCINTLIMPNSFQFNTLLAYAVTCTIIHKNIQTSCTHLKGFFLYHPPFGIQKIITHHTCLIGFVSSGCISFMFKETKWQRGEQLLGLMCPWCLTKYKTHYMSGALQISARKYVCLKHWHHKIMNDKLITARWRHQMKTFSALLALCVGIQRSPGNKGQWRGALVFSWICA